MIVKFSWSEYQYFFKKKLILELEKLFTRHLEKRINLLVFTEGHYFLNKSCAE